MNASLSFKNGEDGFVYPFALFVLILLSTVILTTLNMYKMELYSNERLLAQLQAESMVPLVKDAFYKEDPSTLGEEGTLHYTFPRATVQIQYERDFDSIFMLKLIVTTEKEHSFTFHTYVDVNI